MSKNEWKKNDKKKELKQTIAEHTQSRSTWLVTHIELLMNMQFLHIEYEYNTKSAMMS